MELNIDMTHSTTHQNLNISNERNDELIKLIDDFIEKHDGQKVYKAEAFKAMAEFCNTVEELVYCIYDLTRTSIKYGAE